MRKILTILLTVLMVATLGTVNVFGGDTYENNFDSYYVEADKTNTQELSIKVGDSKDIYVSTSGQKLKFKLLGTEHVGVVSGAKSGQYIILAGINYTCVVRSHSGYVGELCLLTTGGHSASGFTQDLVDSYNRATFWFDGTNDTYVEDEIGVTKERSNINDVLYKSYHFGEGFYPESICISLSGKAIGDTSLRVGSKSGTGSTKINITVWDDDVITYPKQTKTANVFVYTPFKNYASVSGLNTATAAYSGQIHYSISSDSGDATISEDGDTLTINTNQLPGRKVFNLIAETKTEEYSASGKNVNGSSSGVTMKYRINKADQEFINQEAYGIKVTGEEQEIGLNFVPSYSGNSSYSGAGNYNLPDFTLTFDTTDPDTVANISDSGYFYNSISGKNIKTKYNIPEGNYTLKFDVSSSGNEYYNSYSEKVTVVVEVEKAQMSDITIDFGGQGGSKSGKNLNDKYYYLNEQQIDVSIPTATLGQLDLIAGVDYATGNDTLAGQFGTHTLTLHEVAASKYIKGEDSRQWEIVESHDLDKLITINEESLSKKSTEENLTNYYVTDLSFVYNEADHRDEIVVDAIDATIKYSTSYTAAASGWKTSLKDAISEIENVKDTPTRIYYQVSKQHYETVYGYIDVVVIPAVLYAMPVQKTVYVDEINLKDYAASKSGGIELRYFRRNPDRVSWTEVDSSKCFVNNKIETILPENANTKLGAYDVDIKPHTPETKLSTNYQNKWYEGTSYSSLHGYTNDGFKAVTLDENNNVVMDEATSGRYPVFVDASETLIVKADLSDSGLTVDTPHTSYSGFAAKPNPTVKAYDITGNNYIELVEDVDYELGPNAATHVDAGTYTYKIAAKGYSVKQRKGNEFIIDPKAVDVIWTPAVDNTYAGQNSTSALPTATFSGLVPINYLDIVETLTPYVEYSTHDVTNSGSATASISGKSSDSGVSWKDGDTAKPTNYVLNTLTQSTSGYEVVKRLLNVTWVSPNSNKTYDGTYSGQPTASFNNLVDGEYLAVRITASKSGNNINLTDIIDVGVYDLVANLPEFDNSNPETKITNYEVASNSGTTFTIVKMTSSLIAAGTKSAVWKNLGEKVTIKTNVPCAASKSGSNIKVEYKVAGSNDNTYQTLETADYTVQHGCTLITLTEAGMNKLDYWKTYTFKISYKEIEDATPITADCSIYFYSKKQEEEPVVEQKVTTVKKVVNTAAE